MNFPFTSGFLKTAFPKIDLQSNSVITNSTGPRKFVRYNREIDIYKHEGTIWDQKSGDIFVRYSREFVITVIVITEFDCTLIFCLMT